jgi:hypothetical protein
VRCAWEEASPFQLYPLFQQPELVARLSSLTFEMKSSSIYVS